MEALIAKLKQDPNVEYVEPNGILRKFTAPNDTQYSSQYSLGASFIKAEAAWDITIENKTAQNMHLAIDVVVTDKQQKVYYKAQTTNIAVRAGWTNLDGTALQTQIEVQNVGFEAQYKNEYYIHYAIRNVNDNIP